MACALACLDAAATCHKDDIDPLKGMIMIIEAISQERWVPGRQGSFLGPMCDHVGPEFQDKETDG